MRDASKYSQRGAAAIILILLVVMAGITVMFSGINAQDYKTGREKKTSDALADAKASLIAWSVNQAPPPSFTGGTPGQLPCPEDTSLIGLATEGTAKTSCALPAIGRLPWKTLGLGDLRDGNGDRLWYVVSSGFRVAPINSETTAQLTVDGVANSAVAIIFSPGAPIGNQSRPQPTAALPPNVVQYLDVTNSDGDNVFISKLSSTSFNDRLLSISHADLFNVVEKRVLRDAKNCLDTYAITGTAGKYPWAAQVADVTTYTGVEGVLFGRIPRVIVTNVSGTADPSMPMAWSAVVGCVLYPNTTYWYTSGWQDLVFYQLSSVYQPGSVQPPPANACVGKCLDVLGSGNSSAGTTTYRAILLMAGEPINLQARLNKTIASNYLEGSNVHTNPTPSLSFETYRQKDASFQNVNDLVMCIDGRINCN